MKKWTAALLALVTALALTACAQTQQPVNGGTQQDVSVPAPPDEGYTAGSGDIVQIKGFRSIDIEWVSGEVNVELYDGEGIELTETLLDGSPVTQPMEWRVDEDDSTLDIRSQPQLVSLTEEKCLTVKLPRSTVLYELDIDAVSADVSVDLTEEDTLTLDELDQETFNTVVEEILNAKHIYILGVRSSYALSSFIGFYFNLMFDNVRLVHTTSASEAFEQILRVGEGDVVLGISFPRYSRRTLQALEYARDSGATVIALTDSRLSPLSQTAHYTLIAKSDMASFVDSLVAPLSVINALIVALGMRKQQEVSDIFNKLETIWDESQVYEKLDNE